MQKNNLLKLALFAGALILVPRFSFAEINSTTFFVDPAFEIDGKTKEISILPQTSTHAYFYVEKNYYDGLLSSEKSDFDTSINTIMSQFDNQIYPKVREVFGSEWSPGIDKDTKITIYFSEMPLIYNGYFRELDESESSLAQNSNKREMIYLNARYIKDARLPAMISHEFQHLIQYNQKKHLQNLNQERWLNEGLSEYAVSVAGFAENGDYLRTRAINFKNNPNTSLVVWENKPENYSTVSLFIHYLKDQYGDSLISTISKNQFVGTQSIQEALKFHGINKDFSQIYSEWVVALFLNQDIGGSGLYAYKNPLLDFLTLHINVYSTFDLNDSSSVSTNNALEDFSTILYRFRPLTYSLLDIKFLTLNFKTFDSTDFFVIPVVQTDLVGNIKVSFYKISGGFGTIDIPNFNNSLSSVVVIPFSNTKLSLFDKGNNRFRILTTQASLNNIPKSINDGDLIKVKDKPEVYVIKGNYRRWIPSPEIFNGYGHLKWENIKEIAEELLNTYKESFLVQNAGDYKVYEIKNGIIKQWLNVTSQVFENSGKSWSEIYIINENEFKVYK